MVNNFTRVSFFIASNNIQTTVFCSTIQRSCFKSTSKTKCKARIGNIGFSIINISKANSKFNAIIYICIIISDSIRKFNLNGYTIIIKEVNLGLTKFYILMVGVTIDCLGFRFNESISNTKFFGKIHRIRFQIDLIFCCSILRSNITTDSYHVCITFFISEQRTSNTKVFTTAIRNPCRRSCLIFFSSTSNTKSHILESSHLDIFDIQFNFYFTSTLIGRNIFNNRLKFKGLSSFIKISNGLSILINIIAVGLNRCLNSIDCFSICYDVTNDCSFFGITFFNITNFVSIDKTFKSIQRCIV